ncbi:MAG: glycosyltransferase family 2 protein, partial [Thermoproteota archaeon]
MKEKEEQAISRQMKGSLLLFLTFGVLLIFLLFIPSILTWISFSVSLLLTGYLLFQLKRDDGGPQKRRLPSLFSVILLVLPFLFGGVVAVQGYPGEAVFSLTVIAVGLTMTFWNNFLTMPLAVYHKRKETRKEPLRFPPEISVIVPAYNEEEGLRRTLEGILEADYPSEKKEVIVVDDGSTDRTLAVASLYRKRGIKVYHKEHGGKYSAINYGLKFAHGEIIITVDADSIIGRRALKELVKNFQDPEVAAACGNIKVLNRENWITRCQALEYILGINILRRALDVFGAVTVVPGGLGAFRKEILEGGGLYDKDTLTEDFDVTVKTLKTGRIVQASSYALAYTQAPKTLKSLYKQRMRWYTGNLQTLIKHRDAFLNPRFD